MVGPEFLDPGMSTSMLRTAVLYGVHNLRFANIVNATLVRWL
jgi:hypothetical protein